jgi:hypothetical protein
MTWLLAVLVVENAILFLGLMLKLENMTHDITEAIKDARQPLSPDRYVKMFETPNTAGTLRRGDLPVNDPRVTGRAAPTLSDLEIARRNQAHTHGDDES